MDAINNAKLKLAGHVQVLHQIVSKFVETDEGSAMKFATMGTSEDV